MAFTTFTGPLRSGTIKGGAGRNTGLAVLAQSLDSGDLTGDAIGNYDFQLGALPEGSQVVDIVIDQTTAATAGTTTVSVGSTSGGAELMAGVATTAGGRFRGAATAATQAAWQTSTSADTSVFVRVAVAGATLTAGRFVATVLYVQRDGSGAQNP